MCGIHNILYLVLLPRPMRSTFLRRSNLSTAMYIISKLIKSVNQKVSSLLLPAPERSAGAKRRQPFQFIQCGWGRCLPAGRQGFAPKYKLRLTTG